VLRWVAVVAAAMAVATAPGAHALPAVAVAGTPIPANYVSKLLVDPDTGLLYHGTVDGLLVTDDRGSVVRRIATRGEVSDVALSPDGVHLLVADLSGLIVLVERRALVAVARFDTPARRPVSLAPLGVDRVAYSFTFPDLYPGGVAVLDLGRPQASHLTSGRDSHLWRRTWMLSAIPGTGLLVALLRDEGPPQVALVDGDLNIIRQARLDCSFAQDLAMNPTGLTFAPICRGGSVAIHSTSTLLPVSEVPTGPHAVAGAFHGGIFASGFRINGVGDDVAVTPAAGAGGSTLADASLRYEISEGSNRQRGDRHTSPRGIAFSADGTSVYALSHHPWPLLGSQESVRLHVLPLRLPDE
jgi:DNA-binding beta-propeller fold protein YncE